MRSIRTVTGSTETEGPPIRRVPQPIRVIVAQDQTATPDEPTDLTEPKAPSPEPAPAPAAAPVRTIAPGPVVDESALRYFARTGDKRRLDAEIARLKALYPDWVPPADPSAPEIFVDPELDAFWQLFSEGKYAEVRSGIAERRAREPDWVPPDALIELLDEADARIRLTNASNAKQWKTVIDTAAAHAEPAHLRLCRRAVAGGGGLRQYRPGAARQGRLHLHPHQLQRSGRAARDDAEGDRRPARSRDRAASRLRARR